MKHASSLLKRLVTLYLLLGSFLTASAQDILWEKSYGDKHPDYLFGVIATPDYGFILAG